MRRPVLPWLLLGGLGVLSAGCITVEREAEPEHEPDRIVGIELTCDLVTSSQSPFSATTWRYTGWDVCSDRRIPVQSGAVPEGWANFRKELTIRSSDGGTYMVSYGAEHEVWLGMEWPPR